MTTTTTTRTFTSAQVCKLAGITYRQLDYWDRQGYVHSTMTGENWNGQGTGYSRAWPPLEVAKACALAGMLRNGITLARAREAVQLGVELVLIERELREAIIDDLPPDSRPRAVIVRGTGS